MCLHSLTTTTECGRLKRSSRRLVTSSAPSLTGMRWCSCSEPSRYGWVGSETLIHCSIRDIHVCRRTSHPNSSGNALSLTDNLFMSQTTQSCHIYFWGGARLESFLTLKRSTCPGDIKKRECMAHHARRLFGVVKMPFFRFCFEKYIFRCLRTRVPTPNLVVVLRKF